MKIIFTISAILILLYAGAMSYFYFDLTGRNRQLAVALDEAKQFRVKVEDELGRMDSLAKGAQKENEQLKKESLDYLKLEKETTEKYDSIESLSREQTRKIKDLQKQLKEAGKLEEALKSENAKLADINDLAGSVEVMKERQKMAKLSNELADVKSQLNRQEALLHYNLAVGYTREKNYEMAIDEYEKAISLDPKDADSHYNLAIIYDEYRKNPKRAVQHYKKYLEIRPDAADVDEVKDWINRLES